jgi:hypothetical protein
MQAQDDRRGSGRRHSNIFRMERSSDRFFYGTSELTPTSFELLAPHKERILSQQCSGGVNLLGEVWLVSVDQLQNVRRAPLSTLLRFWTFTIELISIETYE